MTDFTKLKMAFSVALLAALFMLRPLFEYMGQTEIVFLGVRLSLQIMYFTFAGTLGLSAYFFALELVSGRSAPFAQRAGNTMYALALLIPGAFAAIVLIAYTGSLVGSITGSPSASTTVEGLLTVVAGVAVLTIVLMVRRAMGERDRSFSVRALGNEEAEQLAKANGLLEAGLYDLVVVQSFQTLETSLKRLLLANGVYSRNSGIKGLVTLAQKHNLIGNDEGRSIQDVRVLRNEVAHEAKAVSRDTAEQVVEATRRVITRVNMALSEGNGDVDPDEAD